MGQSKRKPASAARRVDARRARYFRQIQETVKFNSAELELLEKNGFVVTDRLAFEKFKRAYAYIYWKDLPVLVTTDSILHAVHLHYKNLLDEVEGRFISDFLDKILNKTRRELRDQAFDNTDQRLSPIFEDLDVYLCVAHEALMQRRYRGEEQTIRIPARAQPIIDALKWINLDEWARAGELSRGRGPSGQLMEEFGLTEQGGGGLVELNLFGAKQLVDFSQFKVRGRYAEDTLTILSGYFVAMMWLALVNFPLMTIDRQGAEQVNKSSLAAAHLLHDALDRTRHRHSVDTIDKLLRAFVGWSDNVTMDGLDNLIRDTGASRPADYFDMNDQDLIRLLRDLDYGQQLITGMPLYGLEDKSKVTPRPVIFSLMGQRFTLESWIMGELVHDRLVIDGKTVKRPYPSPLDIMAALGNNRAFDHLADEFRQYGYERRLKELRAQVETYSSEFWESTFYNRWLRAICSLNDLSDDRIPLPMRSDAWADKMLHCQLASWTQLRYDNVLFIKQPYDAPMICEYPAGYVEPYPAFYAAVKDYADFGYQVFDSLILDLKENTTTPVEVPRLLYFAGDDELPPSIDSVEVPRLLHLAGDDELPPSVDSVEQADSSEQVMSHAKSFFTRLSSVASQLKSLAEKELEGLPFSQDEELFLRSVVVRKSVSEPGYGGSVEETWGGWYSELVGYDESPAVATDVFSNLGEDRDQHGVLQVATGVPVAAALIVDSENGGTMYLGPVFTYHEFRLSGYPLKRLDKKDWWRVAAAGQSRIGSPVTTEPALIAPDWVASFRRTCDTDPIMLKLPGGQDDLRY